MLYGIKGKVLLYDNSKIIDWSNHRETVDFSGKIDFARGGVFEESCANKISLTCCPDLDNHLFGMQSKRFNSVEDIQERVDDFVTDEQPSFFEDGIYNLQMRKDYGEDEYFETSDLVT